MIWTWTKLPNDVFSSVFNSDLFFFETETFEGIRRFSFRYNESLFISMILFIYLIVTSAAMWCTDVSPSRSLSLTLLFFISCAMTSCKAVTFSLSYWNMSLFISLDIWSWTLSAIRGVGSLVSLGFLRVEGDESGPLGFASWTWLMIMTRKERASRTSRNWYFEKL